jgi:hypothetical protein
MYKTMVHNSVTKLSSTGPAVDKNKSQQTYVMIEEQLYNISTQSEATFQLSHLSVFQCGMAKSTAHTDTKFLKLWVYKTTVTHSL